MDEEQWIEYLAETLAAHYGAESSPQTLDRWRTAYGQACRTKGRDVALGLAEAAYHRCRERGLVNVVAVAS